MVKGSRKRQSSVFKRRTKEKPNKAARLRHGRARKDVGRGRRWWPNNLPWWCRFRGKPWKPKKGSLVLEMLEKGKHTMQKGILNSDSVIN